MSRRLTTWLTLVCYGVIALCGEGLHAWFHDHAHEAPSADCRPVAVCHHHGHSHGHHHHHNHSAGDQTKPQGGSQPQENNHHHHDSDNCVVCQHHSLGQLCVAPTPAPSGPAASDELIVSRTESAFCPALFSPAQPRGPPACS